MRGTIAGTGVARPGAEDMTGGAYWTQQGRRGESPRHPTLEDS